MPKEQATSDSLKILFETIKSRYDFETSRIKRLDNKANNIMGIAGILATLISGFASLTINVTSFSSLEIIILVIFVSSLALLVASFSYGIKAHQVRKFLIIPDPPVLKTMKACAGMGADTILETLIKNYSAAVKENQEFNDTI